MKLALLFVAGCINPLIPPARATTPENETRRDEAAALRERADALGDAHPIARHYYLGLAALRAGGTVPAVDLAAVTPEIAVKLTGVACPVLEKKLGVAQTGNPALHVELEVSVEGCAIDDHTDHRTETSGWDETVVDRVEETEDYQLDCHVQHTGGQRDVSYTHEEGDLVMRVRTSPSGTIEACDKIPYIKRTPITHQEHRTSSRVIANRVVNVAVDGVWFARRGSTTESGALHEHDSNESERTIDKSPEQTLEVDATAIRRGVAKLLAAEIAAEEALARAAANDDDRDEHWARAIALGGRDNPLAKRYADDDPSVPLYLLHGPELQDPPQPDRDTYKTRIAGDLGAQTVLRADLQYQEIAGKRGGLAGLSYVRNVLTRDTATRGGNVVDAAIGSAAIGYADGLAWDLALGYGLGTGWRNGRGTGFSVGMRALARITRVDTVQVYYTAVPAYARLELQLPHGSIAFDASGFSVSGRDLWRGAVLLTTQSDRYYLPGHYVSFAAERARVHGRDGDTDLGAPQLTTFWVQFGAEY